MCVLSCKNHEGKLVNSPLKSSRMPWKLSVNIVESVPYTLFLNGTFMQIMENKQQPIDHQLFCSAQQVQRNRELLVGHLLWQTKLHCGHRDDFQHDGKNALVKFRIDSDMPDCKYYYIYTLVYMKMYTACLHNGSKSKTILYHVVLITCERILKEIKKAKYFSILADEVADVSNRTTKPSTEVDDDNNIEKNL